MEHNDLTNKQLNPQTFRGLGIVLIFLGLLLTGGMSALMFWINNAMTDPASTIKFKADSPQSDLLFPILGMVVCFGVSAIVAGAWLAITGRRSKVLIWIMLGLGGILFILANIIPKIF